MGGHRGHGRTHRTWKDTEDRQDIGGHREHIGHGRKQRTHRT